MKFSIYSFIFFFHICTCYAQEDSSSTLEKTDLEIYFTNKDHVSGIKIFFYKNGELIKKIKASSADSTFIDTMYYGNEYLVKFKKKKMAIKSVAYKLITEDSSILYDSSVPVELSMTFPLKKRYRTLEPFKMPIGIAYPDNENFIKYDIEYTERRRIEIKKALKKKYQEK